MWALMENIENKSDKTIVSILKSKLNAESFRQLIWLILVFISLGLFCLSIFHTDEIVKNLINNQIELDIRNFYVLFMCIFALTGVIVFTILYLVESYIQYYGLNFSLSFKFNDQVIQFFSLKDNLLNATKWLRILVILFLIPVLLLKEEWRNHEIFYLFLLTAIGMFVYTYFNSFYNMLESKIKFSIKETTEKPIVLTILGLGILLYIAYVTQCSFIRYERFQSYTWDMGSYINFFWNTFFNNKFMGSEIMENGNYLGCHFELLPLIIIGPFYYYFPTPKTFYVIQNIFIALGSIPIYLIGYHLLKSRWIALIFAFCYFFNPALHSSNMWDYHIVSMLPLVLGMMIYFLLIDKHRWFYILLPILLLMREDMTLVLSFVMLFFLFYRKKYTVSVIAIGICIVWFVLCRSVLMPMFGDTGEGNNYGFGYRYAELIPYGKSPVDLVKSILINPVYAMKIMFTDLKIVYFFQMMLPFFFLPLLRPRYWFFFLYGFLITMLTSMDYMCKIAFQYPLYWILGVIVATIFVTADIKNKQTEFLAKLNYKAVVTTVVFLSFILSYQYGLILNRAKFTSGWTVIEFDYTDTNKAKYKYFHEMIDRLIPQKAVVSADEFYYPHVSGTRHTFFLSDQKNFVEYVITGDQNFNNQDYELLENKYDVFVYKRVKNIEYLPQNSILKNI